MVKDECFSSSALNMSYSPPCFPKENHNLLHSLLSACHQTPVFNTPKLCDSCQTVNAVLYCKPDAAFLCFACDVKVHGANKLASRHERVWMCDVCEQAPAYVTCKADAAALCVACDADIHSANPLARRHERIPVAAFYECPSMIGAAAVDSMLPCVGHDTFDQSNDVYKEDDDESCVAEAVSWLLSNPKIFMDEPEKHGMVMSDGARERCHEHNPTPRSQTEKLKTKFDFLGVDFFPDVDHYLDLEYASSVGVTPSPTNSIMPIHSASIAHASPAPSSASASSEADMSLQRGFSYSVTSMNQSMSSTSPDMAMVPDSNFSDSSTPFNVMRGMESPPCALQIGQLEPMAREARVQRYKEKRKNRKFVKTIRYASRKAYAEIRPRIKGRFAKRSDVEFEQLISMVSDNPYGAISSN